MPDAPPDAKVYMDAPAPNFDFSCSTNPAPTLATATITLTGTVRELSLSGATAVMGASVEACKVGTNCMGGNRFDTDTTIAGGAFTLGPINTNNMPLDVFLHTSAAGLRPNYLFPPQALQADLGMIPVLTIQSQVLSTICNQNDANSGSIALAIADCTNAVITDTANVTIEIKQGGTALTSVTVVNLGMLFAQAAGTFLVCNVPPNDTTTVGASYSGMQLRAHDVRVVTGTTTTTALRPGYL